MHWTWLLSMLGSWWTRESTGPWHMVVGYLALALVVVRVVMGLGSRNRYIRFDHFARPWRETWQYALAVRARTAPRHRGHNPLGGWMVLALLATMALLGLTGWLGTTDYLWGYAWLVNLHAALAWLMWGLMAVHVMGVGFTSLRYQENLVLAMVTGRKRPAQQGDVV